MGVRNTANDNKVAMFDSTSGVAFGPVFSSEIECDDFLTFVENVYGVDDVRSALSQLDVMYAAFVDAEVADGIRT